MTKRQELRDGGPFFFVVALSVLGLLVEQLHLPNMVFVVGLGALVFVGLPMFMVFTDE